MRVKIRTNTDIRYYNFGDYQISIEPVYKEHAVVGYCFSVGSLGYFKSYTAPIFPQPSVFNYLFETAAEVEKLLDDMLSTDEKVYDLDAAINRLGLHIITA